MQNIVNVEPLPLLGQLSQCESIAPHKEETTLNQPPKRKKNKSKS